MAAAGGHRRPLGATGVVAEAPPERFFKKTRVILFYLSSGSPPGAGRARARARARAGQGRARKGKKKKPPPVGCRLFFFTFLALPARPVAESQKGCRARKVKKKAYIRLAGVDVLLEDLLDRSPGPG